MKSPEYKSVVVARYGKDPIPSVQNILDENKQYPLLKIVEAEYFFVLIFEL